MIRRLELNEIKSIYRALIKKDFPRNERRPFFSMSKLHSNGKYICLVLEEDNQIIAYATFITDDVISSVLLDYFAVDEKLRGSGIGSRFIALIREYWYEKYGIIIECETPDSTKTDNEKVIRKRRIDFYRRAGAEDTSVKWRFIGVHYRILWLPTSQSVYPTDVAGDLPSLYSLSLPSALRPFFIRMMKKSNDTIPKESK